MKITISFEHRHISRHKTVIKAELVIQCVDVILHERLEVNEEDGEASVPEVDLFGIFGLGGFLNFLVQ